MSPRRERSWLEREYSPSSCVDDVTAHLTRYAADSARARAALTVHRDLRCGPLPGWRLDLFPAAHDGAPLVVFVHGGYWQELSKDEAAFAAEPLVAAGVSFAALGYGLAPVYSMTEITAATSEALRRVCTGRAALPGSPREVHLVGHSAGAHLVASTLLDAEGWRRTGALPATAVSSATLLSGVYDLRPLRDTYVNEALRMSAAEAQSCSPLFRLPGPPVAGLREALRPPEIVVARGEHETSEFARQQREFAQRARQTAAGVTELVVPGRNHFDLPFDLGDPATALGAEVTRLTHAVSL